MAGLFGSITIKGNRLTEFASQTSTVGIPMPFGFGKFPCEGNIIFAPMPPKEHVKKKKQGKGGVKTEEYSYTLSYAIAFCEGPIFGYWTIKRNGKIVWTQDPSASVDDRAYAAKWARKATFYYGTETQLPDSTIESYKGAGKVSAHRGVAYIVVEDDDVTDNGGAVPTYEAVIIASPPDAYLTSRPYPNDMAPESVQMGLGLSAGELRPLLFEEHYTESVDLALTLGFGDFRTPIVPYNVLAESISNDIALGAGRLYDPIRPYNVPQESINLSADIPYGWLRVALVNYDRYPPESVNMSASLGEGTLGP